MNILNDFFKTFKLLTETFFAYIFYLLFRYLVPVTAASRFGGFLGYYVLSKINISRKAECIHNVKLTFPEKTNAEVLEIYKLSCNNFLRCVFELPKLDILFKSSKYITIEDPYNSLADLQNKRALFFTAHYSNWELVGKVFMNAEVIVPYKAPSNKFMEQFFLKMRLQDDSSYKYKMIKLNRSLVLKINQDAKQPNFRMLMLVDQKVREGILVNFLNRPAYTTHLLPMLAVKHNLPLIPIKIVRNSGVNFSIHIEKPLNINGLANNKDGIAAATQIMNDNIGSWIKEDPTQWFWLHKRW